MERNKSFLTATEVAECLGVSKSKAYQIIRQLNDELKSQGYLTVAGKISRQYLEERVYKIYAEKAHYFSGGMNGVFSCACVYDNLYFIHERSISTYTNDRVPHKLPLRVRFAGNAVVAEARIPPL